jgi:rhamnopyranosyl-N-acetylglucosaminyl-diphospho-decaprenol beta-1,3/1,4-galactofuranosyltransferase
MRSTLPRASHHYLPLPDEPSIAAVVVTRDRASVLRRCLAAVRAQERSVSEIFVVDNASTDRTAELIREEFPEVLYQRMDENLGFGAGLAVGMKAACERDHDLIWMLDDDSFPSPTALETCVQVFANSDEIGIVGLDGGLLRWGVPRHGRYAGSLGTVGEAQLRRCDFVLVDGACVPRRVAEQVGVPRSDFFMMMEDVEYSSRIGRSGWKVAVLKDRQPMIHRAHLGSSGDDGSASPWRLYYQTRNHLLIAIDHRDPLEVLGWALRQAKFLAAVASAPDRRWARLKMRTHGAWDAIKGIRGRTIEP